MTKQNKTPVATAVEQAIKPEVEQQQLDPAAIVRQAVAGNFIQHCVNAAVTEKAEQPLAKGIVTAINELLVVALNQDIGLAGKNIPLIAQAISTVGFGGGETNLAEQLMITWAVAAGRSGQLNTLLGKLRDASEVDYQRYVQEQFAALRPTPAPVAAVESEEVPAPVNEIPDVLHQEELDAEKAESLPAEAVPVDVEVVPVEA